MSVRLEGIVRPFTTPNVFTARRTVSIEPKPAVETAILSWGDGIDPTFLRPDAVLELKDLSEQSRVTETLRVENPDDSSQFVEVERIKSMVMKNLKTGDEQNWVFNNG